MGRVTKFFQIAFCPTILRSGFPLAGNVSGAVGQQGVGGVLLGYSPCPMHSAAIATLYGDQ
jgi:hypothetical protein